jgi:hypothetical protein
MLVVYVDGLSDISGAEDAKELEYFLRESARSALKTGKNTIF